jgi:hypothetical protein
VRGAGTALVLGALLTLAVAAYGLIAVFGASARFAGERAAALEWLAAAEAAVGPDSVPPLTPPVARVLTVSVPLDGRVTRLLLDGRLRDDDRGLLLASVGPAFCLSPREVLFGVATGRLEERVRLARVLGPGAVPPDDGFDAVALGDGGILGLRRRARFCERGVGDPASISPAPRAPGAVRAGR